MNNPLQKIYDNNINHIYFDNIHNKYCIILNNIANEKNYYDIENFLQKKYDEEQQFSLHIETKSLENRNIKMSYLYKLATFLKKLKKKPIKYLSKTTVNVYDDFTYNLLYTLFTYLSTPIAPIEVIYFRTREHNNEPSEIRKIKYYSPSNI